VKENDELAGLSPAQRWRERHRERRSRDPSYDRAWREKQAAKMRDYRAKNPQKLRNVSLKQNYGITLAKYQELVRNQSGLCAICKRPPEPSRTGRKRTLSANLWVDHDHVTGNIRGLLCSNCNLGIGYFRDAAGVLRDAAAYLEASCFESRAFTDRDRESSEDDSGQ